MEPDSVYRARGRTDWGDFLGTGTIAYQKRNWRAFSDARKFARNLRLSS